MIYEHVSFQTDICAKNNLEIMGLTFLDKLVKNKVTWLLSFLYQTLLNIT